jgi:hypothetical protein
VNINCQNQISVRIDREDLKVTICRHLEAPRLEVGHLRFYASRATADSALVAVQQSKIILLDLGNQLRASTFSLLQYHVYIKYLSRAKSPKVYMKFLIQVDSTIIII